MRSAEIRGRAEDNGREGDVGFLQISERAQKSSLMALLWFTTTTSVIIASFIPQVAPDHVNFWRLVLGGPAVAFGIFSLFAGHIFGERGVQRYIELSMIPALAINIVMLQITPATEAVLFNLIITLIFAGYFLRTPALLLTLAGFIVVAVSTLFTEPASQTPYLGSFLVVYVVTITLTVLLMHIQNTETLDALERVRHHSRTDPLTGLATLRTLERVAEDAFSAERAGRDPAHVTGLLLIDLDNFKSANTRYGHLGGDHALRTIGQQLRRVAPPQALIARVGGDEFAVLMHADSRAALTEAGQMLRAAVRAADAVMEMPGVKIDATVGVAAFPEDGKDLSEMLDAADRAMYEQKGKKRHVVPDLERSPAEVDARPAWITRESDEDASAAAEAARVRGLDRMTGANLPLLSTRTPYTRASMLGWAVGSLAVAVALLMPDAQPDIKLTWWMAAVLAFLPMPMMLRGNPQARTLSHLGNDFAALAMLTFGIAVSGGIHSVVTPLLVLMIANQAWFWGTRALAFRIVGPLLVVLSPLIYTSITSSAEDVIGLVRVYATFMMVLVLVGAMYTNRRIFSHLQQRAEELATRDPLTGLSNRRAFSDYVQRQIAAAGEDDQFAIVMIDLDNFKQVNTRHGHRGGDRVLEQVARTLASAARKSDCVARIGGDEFAVVLPGVGVDGARALAERFVAAISESVVARENGVGASAGFALFPLHGGSLDELIFTADSALMAVKASGKGSARVARIVSAVR